MAASAVSWSPATYDEANTWLGFSGGYHVVVPHEDEAVLVAVGLRGRSAEAVARSCAEQDVQDAFVRAVRALVAKL